MNAPLSDSAIASAFLAACLAELDALKPGNVHRYGEDHGMSVADFETSARVAAPYVAEPDSSVGLRIRHAIEATAAAVGHNTNLGIVLMSASRSVLGSNNPNTRALVKPFDVRELTLAIERARAGARQQVHPPGP